MNSDYCNCSDEEENKANNLHTSKDICAAKSKFKRQARVEFTNASKPSTSSHQSQEENAGGCISINKR